MGCGTRMGKAQTPIGEILLRHVQNDPDLTKIYLRNIIQELIAGKKIGDDGAKELALILLEFPRIIEISLWDNNITKVGTIQLANSLKVNTTLKRLFIGKNEIELEGIDIMSKALETNNTLQLLDMGNVNQEDRKLFNEGCRMYTNFRNVAEECRAESTFSE